MQSADYPDLLFVQARGDGGPRRDTKWIIIHATDNTAPARNEAAYASRREDETSAHYYCDDTQTIQALPVGNIAFGALWTGNQSSVQYELCGRSNQLSEATMRQAARQVARDCARYGLPVRKLTVAQVRAGEKGICGHADITYAFPADGGDHTDPGSRFPWDQFIGMVAAAGNPPPKPQPPTPSPRTVTVARWPAKPSTLSQISQVAYGTTARWREIWEHESNRKLRELAGDDPSRIQPGWLFVIP